MGYNATSIRAQGKIPVGADIHAPEAVEITLTEVEGITVDICRAPTGILPCALMLVAL